MAAVKGRGRATLTGLATILVLLVAAAPSSAQEAVAVTVTSDETIDHLWSGDPATIRGLATLGDGTPAAGRSLIVESRPYPYTAPFAEEARITASATGTFSYAKRPLRNLQLRIRGEAGQTSQITNLRVFHLALSGKIKALQDGRQKASEVSAVPAGYGLAKAYLYFCKPKAKSCTFTKSATKRVTGQRMTVNANFTPPEKYADKNWRVIFRYVPKAGWGDSSASERRKPKRTISNLDQTGS